MASPSAPASSRSLSPRQRAALPGSRHEAVMGQLKWLLPALAGGLALAILVWPLVAAQEFSFLLAKDQVALAPERLRVTRAEYRGTTAAGEAFSIQAGTALQRSSADPVVELDRLVASIADRDGPSRVTAPRGRYFIEEDRLEVSGPVQLRSDGGYRIDAATVQVDMKRRTIATSAAVSGTTPIGRFRANSLSGDLAGKRISLVGKVRLRIDQRRGTARP
ncbi:MAG: LPS export ABC transporter periplasmic protein LptC [Alphaproteobacteria bacterium]|nr:LPS export ABC transporter periplasmic protein LptC [Alphaproteobacteria bacterium]